MTGQTPSERLLSVEEARARVLDAIPGPLPREWLPTELCLGRAVEERITARVTLPPWDNSAMDGYAVRAADLEAASEDSPVRLSIVGDLAAGGEVDREVPAGGAVRIATGAPVPPGSDAVVPVEDSTPIGVDGSRGARGRDARGPLPGSILVHTAPTARANIRARGSDLVVGDLLLDVGHGITPAAVLMAAGAGWPELPVYQRPRVGVLATGDEIRPAGAELGDRAIPDANGPGQRALVAAAGAEPIDLGIAADRLEDVVTRLRAGLAADADALLVTGGVSVGPYDVVKLAFEEFGRIDLWRVAVQPGRPFAFGTASRPGGGPPVLLFGLPGNPVSGFVTFELFVRPALRRLAGHRQLARPSERAVLLDAATKSHARRAFLRVQAERDASGSPRRDDRGRPLVRLSRGPGGQESHVLSALAASDALAMVPEGVDEHPAGGELELWWLDRA